MIEIISHRGNTRGTSDSENNPEIIIDTMKNFKVEVDVWYYHGGWYLGHDMPKYKVDFSFFDDRMYLHCKNLEAVESLANSNLNWFWHQSDELTVTSRGDIWCYPGVFVDGGITVYRGDSFMKFNKNIKGICTDYPVAAREYFL